MGCTNCNTSTEYKTLPSGCNSHGSCGTLSCDKKSVFDWLGNMKLPTHQEAFQIYEIRFKNGRKEYFRNVNNLNLCMGEAVAVEGNPGHDIGTISLSGELVKVQMQKRKIVHDSEDIKKIYRKASQSDIEIWESARAKEAETQKEARILIDNLQLQMKLSDVEYQGDGKKATFFYTAETRVDFRQLIKDMASKFSIRIEMKQVDYRHEAGRLGGIGSCGRELCCSTWLTDFRKVNTNAARYQQLSLSPQKLQGQCGKLKCCLNYELDSYMDALKEFPDTETKIDTEVGTASFIKMDVFKGVLWYAYDNNREDFKWYNLTYEQVNEAIALNKEGKKAKSLADIEIVEVATGSGFENVVGADSITRFDRSKKKKKKNKNGQNRNNNSEQKVVNKNVNAPQQTKNAQQKQNNQGQNIQQNPNNKQNNQRQNNNNKSINQGQNKERPQNQQRPQNQNNQNNKNQNIQKENVNKNQVQKTDNQNNKQISNIVQGQKNDAPKQNNNNKKRFKPKRKPNQNNDGNKQD